MTTEIDIFKKAASLGIPIRRLPDNEQWQNRVEIKSESSDNLYVVAQNKRTGKWGCNCPGYLRHRKCKHLTEGFRLPLSMVHGRDHLEAPVQKKGVEDGKKTRQ